MQITREVEVEVDVDDILDGLTDKELAVAGLMRVKPANTPLLSIWCDVQQAIRRRDQRRLDDLISSMAWDQAGVILPVGIPLTH